MSLFDRVLDASVLLSFNRSGYLRHSAQFDPSDLSVDLTSRRIAVTGANSGIGEATARALANRGAHVLMLCRSKERGEAARAAIVRDTGNDSIELVLVDMSTLDSVRAAALSIGGKPLDALIHNAGVLPNERQITPDGNELTLATNLLGPFLMSTLLAPELASGGGGRLLFVTSGGMYPTRLSMKDFQQERAPFDGVKAYSRTKRAQVVMTEQLAQRFQNTNVVVHSMHPGWADTPAVASSIPTFHKVMSSMLRTPAEGADTLIWLAISAQALRSTGALWFDRRPVATHYFPGTRASQSVRDTLWKEVCALCGVDEGWTATRDNGPPA